MRDPLLEQIAELQAVVDRLREEATRTAAERMSVPRPEPMPRLDELVLEVRKRGLVIDLDKYPMPPAPAVMTDLALAWCLVAAIESTARPEEAVHLVANWTQGEQEATTVCGLTLSTWGEDAKRGTGDTAKVRGCPVCTTKAIEWLADALAGWERAHRKIAVVLGLPFLSARMPGAIEKRLKQERAVGRAEVRDILWRAWAVLDTTRACVENEIRAREFSGSQPGIWPDVLDARMSGGDGIKQAMEDLGAELPDLAERIKARDAAQEPDAPDGAA